MQREIQAVFNAEFVPTTREWAVGTVGVIDESSFVKRGCESVEEHRPHHAQGSIGKVREVVGQTLPLQLLFLRRLGVVDAMFISPKTW